MTERECDDMRLLVQADLDGELQPAEAARVAAHLAQCPACSAVQARLVALSEDVRRDVRRFPASDALRKSIEARVAKSAPAPRKPRWLVPGLSFGSGFALAACLALLLVLPRGGALPDALVAAHIRALQPGHLMDVVSTDQHTVKPWFDGRLPFAPPVKDLAAEGFRLVGGRLDYLDRRSAAALVYQRDKHLIDLFVWPEEHAAALPGSGSRDGYNFVQWRDGGMVFWAVSDLEPAGLAQFAEEWQRH